MIGFIGTCLQLQLIITARTLNSFWMPYEEPLPNLSLISHSSLLLLQGAEKVSYLNSSQSHMATYGQLVSKSWCRAPSGAHDQIFSLLFDSTVLFLWGALSDERTVCLLYMLLAPASAVFLGFESLGTGDHILLSQIWDFLFVASCDSEGHGGGIRPHLHTGSSLNSLLHGPHRRQHPEHLIVLCYSSYCHGNAFVNILCRGNKWSYSLLLLFQF
jgi:hypothetical protein